MPDFWVVIKMNGKDTHYRLAMAWKGGYIDGDSWRINSGIVRVVEDLTNDCTTFTGSSGSAYTCSNSRYGVDTQISGLINLLTEIASKNNGTIDVLPKDTDWKSTDWIITK